MSPTKMQEELYEFPGDPAKKSLYRAELGGIAGIPAIVDCVAQVLNSTKAKLKVGLDGA
jgi:hypothetical protein